MDKSNLSEIKKYYAKIHKFVDFWGILRHFCAFFRVISASPELFFMVKNALGGVVYIC